MEEQIFALVQAARRQEELAVISKMNQKTERFGIVLKEPQVSTAKCNSIKIK